MPFVTKFVCILKGKKKNSIDSIKAKLFHHYYSQTPLIGTQGAIESVPIDWVSIIKEG